MNTKKVAFHTLGCKLNYAETSVIGNSFLRRGFSLTDFDSPADVYVINTCTVTENAERECRQIIRRALRHNPNGFVIVTGCYAQLRPEQIQKIEGVDLVLGSKEKFEIFNFIDSFEKKNLACVYVTPLEKLNDFGPAFTPLPEDRTRAFLKIQDGCDYKCSFCTIPKARGLSRSQSADETIKQLRELVQQGYKEIVLTGVNVGDYGSKIGTSLYELLKKLIKVDGDFRIRISSIEPNLLSDEIIELVAQEDKLCKHFHIPLQSGSDKILKRMQRRYLSKLYADRIEKVKTLIPSAGIGVDVIVGFPGEDENDFQTTQKFIANLPVSYLHVFTYSERPGTPAAEMKDQVPKDERRRRTNTLRILSARKKYQFYLEMLGTEQKVLFEHRDDDGTIKGFTSNYIRVVSDSPYDLTNKFADFRLTDLKNELVVGEILKIYED
ncbi:MAG: tRNA (N(6)-L-threonylcarbamoyladenosine(37)-C(2))-methylthiotransferase MtaB [Ignavibacteria bacterium]|jgi:threonylcarbamoyladenosine tRNA methylthiotransferase MtaB|nr:tRNA (N(6)-L-threonylcarbamoyladenosine(37)-C(2))-methylthiotransferase MtaB [Ignavibacteria bacterium]MDH7527323.1 tRNA (N(6)-L-threonylcarbamoyladenosine(37)-C(2))-methylthiotransferase MtaB [Ignavibacteria bacterium]